MGQRLRGQCELSKAYGFPVFGLQAHERVALEVNLGHMKARERLDAALDGAVQLSPDQWYELALQVHGDEGIAESITHAAIRASWG